MKPPYYNLKNPCSWALIEAFSRSIELPVGTLVSSFWTIGTQPDRTQACRHHWIPMTRHQWHLQTRPQYKTASALPRVVLLAWRDKVSEDSELFQTAWKAFEACHRKLPALHEFKANALGNHYIESLNAELTGHCHRYVMGLCSSCSHGGDESLMLHLPPECFKLVLSGQCMCQMS